MADEQEQPVEIEDEYKLGLDIGVEDESAEEGTSGSFTITSYGADYPVDTLVKRMKGEAFFIPKFQRNFVWSQRHASRFIESLLMGLPVPGIFLYKEADTGRHMVVDGQQRLRTLEFFYTGIFKEKAFRLVGVRSEWEGKTYNELDSDEKLKLDDAIVHATIFQQDEPKNSLKSLYFVFERINSGGIRLSPQEIRNCISEGPVLERVRLLNDDENWRAIFGEKKNTRLKDQELVLRALAMIHNRANYAAPMRDFLNSFVSEENQIDAATLSKLDAMFRQVMKIVNEAKGTPAFRPIRALNAAVFEAVTVGIAELLSHQAKPVVAQITQEYDKLLKNEAFMKACTSATATEEAVKTRQRLAIEAFADI
ncbi:GmrSD restriction endonuclease domain-containing protein [Taklimakanibacter lacteus]|uniref:GmrSD restriction endonuclease domain-containing protein n=1 Tax=Taklimakanibacter lacteus TaxID=2268456 RepID=UPI000E65EE37